MRARSPATSPRATPASRRFVDANFSLPGALRLHREALGLDLLRAPANVALVPPFLAVQLGAAGLRRPRRAGARRAGCGGGDCSSTTDVARELTFRLHRDLLELPYDDGERRTERDALAEAILADPRLAVPLAALAERAAGSSARTRRRAARLQAMLETYAGARSAAADLFNNALLAGTGAALFQKLTPGTFTLGPVLAAAIAHQAAVASFPLGAGLGSLWYAWFPAAAVGRAAARHDRRADAADRAHRRLRGRGQRSGAARARPARAPARTG